HVAQHVDRGIVAKGAVERPLVRLGHTRAGSLLHAGHSPARAVAGHSVTRVPSSDVGAQGTSAQLELPATNPAWKLPKIAASPSALSAGSTWSPTIFPLTFRSP